MLIIWLQGIWLPLHGYHYIDTPLWCGIFLLPLTAGFLVSGPVAGSLHLLAASRVLSSLPAAAQQTITGRKFFPELISGPFHHGLVVVFAVAAALSLLAALASLLRGGRYARYPAAADEAPAAVSAKQANR